jgi:hypothetical protein
MMIAMIDMGKLYREDLRMTGIEGILQRLRDERDDKNRQYHELGSAVNVMTNRLKETEKNYQDVSIEVDALNLAIEAIQVRVNGQVRHEDIGLIADVPVTGNPCKPNTIKWFCYEVLTGVAAEGMHEEDIWKAVKKYRHCSRATVSHELYVSKDVFRLMGDGFFTLVDA